MSAREAAVDKGRIAFHSQRHRHAIAHFSKVGPVLFFFLVCFQLTGVGYKLVLLLQFSARHKGEMLL